MGLVCDQNSSERQMRMYKETEKERSFLTVIHCLLPNNGQSHFCHHVQLPTKSCTSESTLPIQRLRSGVSLQLHKHSLCMCFTPTNQMPHLSTNLPPPPSTLSLPRPLSSGQGVDPHYFQPYRTHILAIISDLYCPCSSPFDSYLRLKSHTSMT